jgi:hypothetical protein
VNPTSFISFARAYRERRNQKLHSQLFDRFRIIPIKIFAGGNREAKSVTPRRETVPLTKGKVTAPRQQRRRIRPFFTAGLSKSNSTN